MGRMSRDKGGRIEREIVGAHREIGVRAERVPLSGGAHYQGNGHDVDVYLAGRDAPLCCEVKARAAFPSWLLTWLADNDALFLRGDHAEPFVVLPWRTWAEMVRR